MDKMKSHVILAEDRLDFETQLDAAMKAGWKLHGNPIVVYVKLRATNIGYTIHSNILQVMVMDKDKSNPVEEIVQELSDTDMDQLLQLYHYHIVDSAVRDEDLVSMESRDRFIRVGYVEKDECGDNRLTDEGMDYAECVIRNISRTKPQRKVSRHFTVDDDDEVIVIEPIFQQDER